MEVTRDPESANRVGSSMYRIRGGKRFVVKGGVVISRGSTVGSMPLTVQEVTSDTDTDVDAKGGGGGVSNRGCDI